MEETITIANISKLNYGKIAKNILRKGIKAKIGDIYEGMTKHGEKYGRYLLVQGNSKANAFAFGEAYQRWKKVLSNDKRFKFPTGTFSYKPTYKKRSTSNCKFDLVFLDGSKPSASAVRSSVVRSSDNVDTSSLQNVSRLLQTSQTFTRKLKSIRFNSGVVYRYQGCKVCNSSIPRQHTDGKYYCKGPCNDPNNTNNRNKGKKRKKIGVETQRKICFTIHNVQLSDDQNQTIESIVIFNSACEMLLKRCGSDFDTDNEAERAWSDLRSNNCFDLTLKRNKKKGKYPPTVHVQSVEKVIPVAPSTCRNSDPDPLSVASDYSYDAKPDEFDGKKKRRKIPKFPKVEMKLRRTTEQLRDHATTYRITSKPPGLVLLINNFNFPFRESTDEKERHGSEIDMKLLQDAFCKMGYEIYGNKCQMNVKTATDFVELINDFRAELRRRDVGSIFIVISSHGRNNEIELPGLGEKEKICVVEDIMIPFSDAFLPEYQGRPKVFMPITCQNLGNSAKGASLEFRDNKLFDMLVCCPSLPGYTQLRIHDKGSFFVRCLVDNLMAYATDWHLREVLDKVQIDMKKEILRKGLDITNSYYLASTFGNFYLNPAEGSEADESNPFQNMEIDSD